MKLNKQMTLSSRIRSFGFAIAGLKHLLTREPNAKIHLLATIIVIVAGIWQNLSGNRWLALVFAIGLVWITELMNTAIERLSDYACDQQFTPAIKIVKDISAAAVLLAAVCSIIIGSIVFLIK